MLKLKDIPLRERKAAKTKLDLLNAMLDKTKLCKLQDISIKELCYIANISEGTFFNYFSKKENLLIFFIKLWSLQTSYLANKEWGESSGLKKIEYIFKITGEVKTIGHKRIMGEIIAKFALDDIGEQLIIDDLTNAEKIMAFPNYEGIETVKYYHLFDIFRTNVELSIKLGELPSNTDIMDAITSIAIIFYGTPLILGLDRMDALGEVYVYHLQNLWKRLKK